MRAIVSSITLRSEVSSSRTGVSWATKTNRHLASVSTAVENDRRWQSSPARMASAKPGSKSGGRPSRRSPTITSSRSTPRTTWPTSAQHAIAGFGFLVQPVHRGHVDLGRHPLLVLPVLIEQAAPQVEILPLDGVQDPVAHVLDADEALAHLLMVRVRFRPHRRILIGQ